MFKFFITFDLKNAQGWYDDFYAKAITLGLTPYIPGKYVESGDDIDLPNTTLYGVLISDNQEKAKNLMSQKVKSIYTSLNLNGRFTVIYSEGSYTENL